MFLGDLKTLGSAFWHLLGLIGADKAPLTPLNIHFVHKLKWNDDIKQRAVHWFMIFFFKYDSQALKFVRPQFHMAESFYMSLKSERSYSQFKYVQNEPEII